MNTDTPLTDDAATLFKEESNGCFEPYKQLGFVSADFARALERHAAELRGEIHKRNEWLRRLAAQDCNAMEIALIASNFLRPIPEFRHP